LRGRHHDRDPDAQSRTARLTLRVEGKPGAVGIRSLRWLLKNLLRQHGFRCLDVSQQTADEPPTEGNNL